MSKLKTVERARDLKLIESKLSILKDSLTDSEDALKKTDKEIDGIIRQLDELDISDSKDKIEELNTKLDSLYEERDYLYSKIHEDKNEVSRLESKLGDFKNGGKKRFSVKDLTDKGVKSSVALATNAAKSSVKSGFSKIDPLSGGINKNDVGDTGMESIRFARQGVNKTVKTVKTANRTIKTSARTIKLAKRTAVRTAKATFKAAAFATKAAVFAGKVAVKTVIHIIAAVFNPITWIVIGVLLIVAMLSSAVVLLMGGAGGGKAVMATGAVGLGDVPAEYMQGVEFFNAAIQTERDGHNALIDVASYNSSNMSRSDLVYMSVTRADSTVVNYNTAFAAPWQTSFLQSATWTYPLNENLLDVNDTIAMAYVLLQKRANETNSTVAQIYSVTYTQAIFDEIVALSVSYNTTVYTNQFCPGRDCTTGEDEEGTYSYCPRSHSLHAIGFWYHSRDEVMDALGFTASDKQWVSLTAAGFESNSQIT